MTGGSRGIGAAIVRALCARGDAVAFTYRADADAALAVESDCDGRAIAFELDLADRDAPDALVAAVEARLGPLWGLVNNAGARRDGLLAMTSDAAWDAALDVNLGGAFRCCRAVARGMVSRRAGSIVNVASLSALHGVAGQASYGAAKAGLLALTRALSRELGKRDVRVNAVVPGFVATDMTADLPEPAVRALRAGETLARGVTPASVAGAALFFLSDAAESVTGQTLIVDAGATA